MSSTTQPVERDDDFNMLHTNGHLLCALDVETTGLEPGVNDILEIAIIPLNHKLEPYKSKKPFYMKLKPKRPETAKSRAMNVSGLSLADCMLNGMDPYKAADLLEVWFNKLELPIRHQIMPLAHNWPFDRDFIIDWLGPLNFAHIFHGHYRDTMTISSFLNDRAFERSEPYAYSKLSLPALCNRLGVENKMEHRALYDSLATAECYKKLVRLFNI